MKNKQSITLLCVMFLATLVTGTALGHEGHTMGETTPLAVSLTADAHGKLWRVSAKQGQVWVDSSQDLGQHFSVPVAVNPKPMKVAAQGEARPKIAISPEGNIYLTWTETLKAPFAGYVWFARSINGGKSFEAPYIVHQDRAEITHRFDALNVAPNGKITVAWVDKRDLIAAKAAGKTYDGAAIYYAESINQGKSFAGEKKLADSSCECCRIALTNKADGTVAAMWRHVFAGSERDHAMAEITPENKAPVIVRASFGHWQIDGCPHHGGALATGAGFGYHMVYFDGAGETPSLKYARMDGEAWVTSPAKKIGNAQRHPAHPAIVSLGDKVWLAWQESASDKAGDKSIDVWVMASEDGGKTWGPANMLLHGEEKVDYPQWVVIKEQPHLVVNTQTSGIKVLPVAKSDTQ